MKVTVWHDADRKNPYRVFEGVDRVAHGQSNNIHLYERRSDNSGQHECELATFGPGHCWAIEAEDVSAGHSC